MRFQWNTFLRTASGVQIGTIFLGSTLTFDIKTKQLVFCVKVIPILGIYPKKTVPNMGKALVCIFFHHSINSICKNMIRNKYKTY